MTVRVAYLVENPIPAIINHLEGNVCPVLDPRNTRSGGLHADTESSSAVSLVIADDELVRTRRGVEVSEGGRRSHGRDQHANWRKLSKSISQEGW